MTKVNVSSNSSLIYRKLVNYGYLFVSTKYEIQKSQSFTGALQQTVAKNIQTFIYVYIHIKLFVNQVSKNMII